MNDCIHNRLVIIVSKKYLKEKAPLYTWSPETIYILQCCMAIFLLPKVWTAFATGKHGHCWSIKPITLNTHMTLQLCLKLGTLIPTRVSDILKVFNKKIPSLPTGLPPNHSLTTGAVLASKQAIRTIQTFN